MLNQYKVKNIDDSLKKKCLSGVENVQYLIIKKKERKKNNAVNILATT